MNVGAVKAPRFGGANHASDHDNRSRYRKVSLSSTRRGCGRPCDHSPSVEASLRAGILPEAAAMPGWHRSVCVLSLLVARTAVARPHGSADAAGLCEALRQAAEERYR